MANSKNGFIKSNVDFATASGWLHRLVRSWLSLVLRQEDGFANHLHAKYFAGVGSLVRRLLSASLGPNNRGMNRPEPIVKLRWRSQVFHLDHRHDIPIFLISRRTDKCLVRQDQPSFLR